MFVLGVILEEGATEETLPKCPFVWSWVVGFDPGGLQEVVVLLSVPTGIFYPGAGCITNLREGMDLKVQAAVLKGLEFIRGRVHRHKDIHKMLITFAE